MKKDGFTTGEFRKASSRERGRQRKVGHANGWKMDKSGSSQPTEASKAVKFVARCSMRSGLSLRGGAGLSHESGLGVSPQ